MKQVRFGEDHPLARARWIWPDGNCYQNNCHAQFRYDFQLDSVPAHLFFFISADQLYRLYVNGRYVCRGPARGYQESWPFDEADLSAFLQEGYNWISAEVYNPGIGTFQYLHRGKYADGPAVPREKWTIRNVFSKLIGITSEYSRGDRFIAYLVFSYSIVYNLIIVFCGIVIWNSFSSWPSSWWTTKFLITSLIVPGVVGIASTIWFLIGGFRDIRQLFIDLANRKEDSNDNGQILHDRNEE